MANPEQPRDDLDDDDERFEDEGRRSIFSALWFRALLVVVVLGVVAAVAVPYILEIANQPPPRAPIALKPESPPPTQPPALTPPTTPSLTPPVAEKPAAPTPDKPAMEKPAPPTTSAPDKPAAPERPATVAKKSDTSAKEPATPRASSPTTSAAAPAPTGAYYVQVGAFKNPDLAKRLAARLREAKYNVEESSMNNAGKGASPAPSAAAPTTGGDKYDVHVTGAPVTEVNAKLSARGLSSEPSSGGVVVKPSLSLREAVALSKDLAVDGLKVQVRRAAGATSATGLAPSRVAPSGEAVYRVRVGPFDDRATATSTLRELEQRGYTPFIARGGQ